MDQEQTSYTDPVRHYGGRPLPDMEDGVPDAGRAGHRIHHHQYHLREDTVEVRSCESRKWTGGNTGRLIGTGIHRQSSNSLRRSFSTPIC